MIKVDKSKLPFIFLVIISVSWGFYYQTSHRLNDFGRANHEWLFLIDALVVLPLICFVCIKDKKQALIKTVVFCSLAVLIGSYIIPDQNKIIWPYFEVLRYLALLIFLALEGVTIWTLYTAIKTTLDTNKDPDDSITNVIINRFGQGIISKLMVFETRMWTYALFSNRIKSEHFQGHEHFSYWRKDGSHSNALGFILIILFEIPVVHLLIHFTWSAVVANVLTLLTVFSLVFFYAEYKAMKIRPVSLTQTEVIIRYGIYNTMYIKFADIETINANQHFIKRSHSIIRYNFSGVPNIAIHLKKPVEGKELIYLGLDQPTNFLSSLTKLKNKESN